jgi:ATP-dependent Lon protease
LPGQIIQGLRRAESKNPVFMLDEIDKIGADFRGDPAAALLEVLDPEQNNTFKDHYVDLPFDLSEVLFITTANVLDTIPPALRDRMEVIRLAGYIEEEKLHIARRHLIPRQLDNHGLKAEHITFADDALLKLIREYTREAGLRNLEREIASIIRKVARKRAEGQLDAVTVTPEKVEEFLGAPYFMREEMEERTLIPGVSIGLSWTAAGGEVLYIEATQMWGAKGLTLTGQLGDVMKESAQAALSWVRAHARQLGIEESFFDRIDIHLHVPEGAIPKDGPSAGITLVTALVSLLTGRPVRPRVSMTGEMTLSGRVLPVGRHQGEGPGRPPSRHQGSRPSQAQREGGQGGHPGERAATTSSSTSYRPSRRSWSWRSRPASRRSWQDGTAGSCACRTEVEAGPSSSKPGGRRREAPHPGLRSFRVPAPRRPRGCRRDSRAASAGAGVPNARVDR